ncbi:hypothetical protein C1645_743425 [Glomus cerebriforme]|uniref:DUF8211 domain-containing protein n=1 Tax=Glomus cerebriforme TaxID=658196 RepID=A0A397S9C5_9GLOM|nr:hypothetical protein C1645_743425 [Glomus cerebriforme]
MTSAFNKTSFRYTSFTKKYVPFQISTTHFHVTSTDHRGHNRIYESKRSKSYLFELDGITPNTNQTHLKIHTNDLLMSTYPITYFSNSHTLNKKYQISKLLTHFFRSQKVIPKRVQHKYFNFIRKSLLSRITFISNRTSHDSNNRTTNTFFYFTYKKYRFHFGIYVPCNFSRDGLCCPIPSPIVLSNNRASCNDHQKWLHNSPIDTPQMPKFSAATTLVFNKSQSRNGIFTTSHRTGVSYRTNIRTSLINKNRPAESMKNIYVKQYSNLTIATASTSTYSAKTLLKQKSRRNRKLASLISYDKHPEDALSNPFRLFNIGARHHYLVHPSQLLKKPIQHVKYAHVCYKNIDNFPLPSYWSKSRRPKFIKESDLVELDMSDGSPSPSPIEIRTPRPNDTLVVRSITPVQDPLSEIISLIKAEFISYPTKFCRSYDSPYTHIDLERIDCYTNFQDEFHAIHTGQPINTLSSMITDERRKILAETATRVLSYKSRRRKFAQKIKDFKLDLYPHIENCDYLIFRAGSLKRSSNLASSPTTLFKHLRIF